MGHSDPLNDTSLVRAGLLIHPPHRANVNAPPLSPKLQSLKGGNTLVMSFTLNKKRWVGA